MRWRAGCRMDNARATFFGGRWHRVSCCGDCHGCMDSENGNQFCKAYGFLVKPEKMSEKCHLLLWEKVRPHGPEEKPNLFEFVNALMNDGKILLLYYSDQLESWAEKNSMNSIVIINRENIVSWRYLV